MSEPKEKPHCPYCGGTDVNCDAVADWDYASQEWVLRSTYTSGYCRDCETELKRFDWREDASQENS